MPTLVLHPHSPVDGRLAGACNYTMGHSWSDDFYLISTIASLIGSCSWTYEYSVQLLFDRAPIGDPISINGGVRLSTLAITYASTCPLSGNEFSLLVNNAPYGPYDANSSGTIIINDFVQGLSIGQQFVLASDSGYFGALYNHHGTGMGGTFSISDITLTIEYEEISFTSITPDHANVAGEPETNAIIVGTAMDGVSKVELGDGNSVDDFYPDSYLELIDNEHMQITGIPASLSGPGAVDIIFNDGYVTASDAFTYTGYNINPDSGPSEGGTLVTISIPEEE